MSIRRRMIIGALGVMLASAACDSDFILSAYNLEIGPSPAGPGDMVVASFRVDLLPTQAHTVTIVVDGEDYLTVSREGPPTNPVLLELGDASTLIESLGTGAHVAHVEVHAIRDNKTARSASAVFELLENTP